MADTHEESIPGESSFSRLLASVLYTASSVFVTGFTAKVLVFEINASASIRADGRSFDLRL